MRRRDVLGAATATLALGACGGASKRGARGTSVLLLVADDLGRRDLGVYGQRSCATPNLDALAAEGLLARRAYTPSALCRPSRTAILSGLHPHRTGRSWYGAVREDLELWPDPFRRGGYAAGIVGKTALKKHEERWGFAEGGDVSYEKGRDPAFFAERTERFLERAGERPFTLVVNFYDPHRAGAKGASEPARLTATQGELRRIAAPPTLPRTQEVLVELRNYFRDVERMDRAAGAVLEVLRARGRAEDTLVLFLSDNGADFPFAKATLYEAGINLPLIARWPGVVAPGTETNALLSFVDLLPTCLAAAGLAPPEGIDGRSFLALLEGRAAAHRDVVFGEHDEHRGETNTPSRSAVGTRWKYVRHFHLEQRFEVAAMRTVSWQSMQRAAREDAALAARMRRLEQRPREELYDLAADPDKLEQLREMPGVTVNLTPALMWEHLDMNMSDPLLSEWDE